MSPDGRFAIAYEAALLYARMAVACAGWRVRGEGAHGIAFEGLRLAVGPAVSDFAAYFLRCRRLRNELTYERAGVVEERDVVELLDRTVRVGEIVEAWISTRHPRLA